MKQKKPKPTTKETEKIKQMKPKSRGKEAEEIKQVKPKPQVKEIVKQVKSESAEKDKLSTVKAASTKTATETEKAAVAKPAKTKPAKHEGPPRFFQCVFLDGPNGYGPMSNGLQSLIATKSHTRQSGESERKLRSPGH